MPSWPMPDQANIDFNLSIPELRPVPMTPDASPEATSAPDFPATPEVSLDMQVRLKTEDGQLLLLLPSETNASETPTAAASTWTELWQQLKVRLNAGERFWQANAEVQLMANDRLLDIRQLQEIAEALSEVELQLKRIHTNRRQTAVAAATVGYCVEQQPPVSSLSKAPTEKPQSLAEPLYLQMTVRSGVEIRHPGTVVLLGDINPGGSIIAGGDILVWGRLRGVVHAGAGGNTKSVIMTLQMEPMVIRIAKYVARGPETSPTQFLPEVAYVTDKGIRIARAADFDKSMLIG